jgi:hypothetical protein
MPRYEITNSRADAIPLNTMSAALTLAGGDDVKTRRAFGWSNQPKVCTFAAPDDRAARHICDVAGAMIYAKGDSDDADSLIPCQYAESAPSDPVYDELATRRPMPFYRESTGQNLGGYYPAAGVARVPYQIRRVRGGGWQVIRFAKARFWVTDIEPFARLRDAKARIEDAMTGDFVFPVAGVDYDGEGVPA